MGFIVLGVTAVIGFEILRRWNKRAAPDVPDAPIRAELGIILGLFSIGLGIALVILRS